MAEKTTFESDMVYLSQCVDLVKGYISHSKTEDEIEILQNMKKAEGYANNIIDITIKYEKFLKKLRDKFAFNIDYDLFMNKINTIKNYVYQIRLNVANGNYKEIKKIIEKMEDECSIMRKSFASIMSLPYVIDYSKLSYYDWSLIGTPGIHYKSKIFLSYPFRNNIPQKDENQQIIDNYIIPLLEQVGIQPIIARSYLQYNELIDDEIIKLIEQCDGIIGFFTNNDNVDNVEHELSYNKNIIALCKEEKAKVPSMRYSRLMINFERDDMGHLVIELLKALKNKKMFYLKQ